MSPDGPVPSLGRTDASILVELLIRAGDERKRSVGLHLAGVDLAVCMSSSATTVEVSCMPTTPPASISNPACLQHHQHQSVRQQQQQLPVPATLKLRPYGAIQLCLLLLLSYKAATKQSNKTIYLMLLTGQQEGHPACKI